MKVNVSSLRVYEFCPRIVYLREVMALEPDITLEQARGLVGHALRKELSLRQTKMLKKVKSEDELNFLINEEFKKIMADLPIIYKDKFSGINIEDIIPVVRGEIESEMQKMSNRLSSMVKEHGLCKALEIVTPYKVEYPIDSKSIGFSGIIDKVMNPLTPIEIKTGKAGEGVWEGDRLQLCAYGMLLEDKFGKEILQGFVEYTRIQEERPVLFTERLRRRVLSTRDEIMDILSGAVPELCPHGNGRKCNSCNLKEKCYSI